jgi:hypothetical protein
VKRGGREAESERAGAIRPCQTGQNPDKWLGTQQLILGWAGWQQAAIRSLARRSLNRQDEVKRKRKGKIRYV